MPYKGDKSAARPPEGCPAEAGGLFGPESASWFRAPIRHECQTAQLKSRGRIPSVSMCSQQVVSLSMWSNSSALVQSVYSTASVARSVNYIYIYIYIYCSLYIYIYIYIYILFTALYIYIYIVFTAQYIYIYIYISFWWD